MAKLQLSCSQAPVKLRPAHWSKQLRAQGWAHAAAPLQHWAFEWAAVLKRIKFLSCHCMLQWGDSWVSLAVARKKKGPALWQKMTAGLDYSLFYPQSYVLSHICSAALYCCSTALCAALVFFSAVTWNCGSAKMPAALKRATLQISKTAALPCSASPLRKWMLSNWSHAWCLCACRQRWGTLLCACLGGGSALATCTSGQFQPKIPQQRWDHLITQAQGERIWGWWSLP